MSYLTITNFQGGLDTRKFKLALPPGTLTSLVNGHITPGGEIEKRKRFDPTQLPVGATFGGQATPAGKTVFGSGAAPVMPADVLYQRLQHPAVYPIAYVAYDAAKHAMTGVVWSELFGLYPFVLAQFADGNVFAYYNGVFVEDFIAGVAEPWLTTNALLAKKLVALINETANYTATQYQALQGATIQSGGAAYVQADVGKLITLSGGAGTLSATLTITQVNGGSGTGAVTGISAVVTGGLYSVLPTNPISVTGSTTGSGLTLLGTFAAIGTFSVLGSGGQNAAVVATTDADNTGSGTIVVQIQNQGTESVPAVQAVGQFTITNGDNTGTVTLVTVNGVNILTSTQTWAGSVAATAAAVAVKINAGANGYTAVASGGTVLLTSTAVANQANINGFEVKVTVTGALVIGNCSFTLAFTSLAYNAGGAVTLAAGTWTESNITDSAGVKLLGTYSSPASSGTGVTAPNLPWNSITNVYKDLVAQINAVVGGTYCAYTDNITLWISKRVTSSNDQPITINVTTGTYFALNSTGSTGLNATVNPTTLAVATTKNGVVQKSTITSLVITGGTPPYSYAWSIVSTKFPAGSAVTNQLYFVTAAGAYAKTDNRALVTLIWNAGKGTGTDTHAALCTITDSQGGSVQVYLGVTIVAPT